MGDADGQVAIDRVRESYDTLAAAYSERLFGELVEKPLDRGLLDELAERARGLVCDLGCGPGHVARYMRERGAEVVGVDLSPAMIEEARRRSPELRFEVGDARSLRFAAGSFGAVVAMYSLIHFEPPDLELAVREIVRVLAPGGVLLAAFHRGSATERVEELWGCPVQLDFHFFEPDRIADLLTAAGLSPERTLERDPYPGVEAQTRRFYVLARKAAPPTAQEPA